MDEKLTGEEQTLLTWIASEGEPIYSRRAILLLLHDQGLTSTEIGAQVGLSAGRVRHWLRSFREKRMDIFPQELLAEAGAVETSPPGLEPRSEILVEKPEQAQIDVMGPEITLEQLCKRYMVDMAHAHFVAEMTLALFDLTSEVHTLSPQRRELIETAALLHNVGFATYPDKHHTIGRDILLEHQLEGFDEIDQMILACITAFHRKKFKPKRLEKEPSFTALPVEVRDDVLAMAALVRMGDGLDYSQSQSSAISKDQISDQGIEVVVAGPFAGEDSARAQQKADFWHQIFDMPIRFMVEGQPEIQVMPEEEPMPEVAPPAKAKSPGILPDDLMSEAGRKVLLFHYQRMLEHEPGTRQGDDIEELHDMRVATRRMRSAFRVFTPYFDPDALKPFRRGLQRTGRALGTVRDLDVFMEKARRYLADLPDQDRFDLDPLLEVWQEQRETARDNMLAFLDGKRYQRFVQEFGLFLATEGAGVLPSPATKPVARLVYQLVPALIYGRYKVIRGYTELIENAPLETLHALRIDCKRFRYSLEFFREVLGPEAREVIDETVIVQDHLGNLNDADVACHLLIEFLEQWSGKERRDRINISGITRYLVAKQSELRSLVSESPQVWQHFNRPAIRRALALAVSTL